MSARLATEADRVEFLRLGRSHAAEFVADLGFDDEIAGQTFQAYIDTAEPTIFVVGDSGRLSGYLLAHIHGYSFTSGVFVSQELIYVVPDKRGTRAAARLIRAFIQWGEALNAKQIFFGISNNFQPERTARLFEHFGAQRVGFNLVLSGAA